jgi:GT2 family glycosyltransferase
MNIDIIILSYAKTDELRQTTLNCIESLLASENPEEIIFETLVIESNKQMQPYQYPGTKTIYPVTAFGYNKYLNIGISLTSNSYVCLCNNDLIFHPNWASEILKAFIEYPKITSANPFSPNFGYHEKIINGENVIRRDKTLDINGVLTGWCIFVKRSVLTKIGPLDERFVFWYADNDYDHTLRKYGIKHALVKSSLVTHLACQSHDLLSDKKDELTTGQWGVFNDKWNRKSLLRKFLSFLKTKLTSKKSPII